MWNKYKAGLNQLKLPNLAPRGMQHKYKAGLNQLKLLNLAPRGVRGKCIVGLKQLKLLNLAPRQNNRFIRRFVVEFTLYVYV